MGSRAPGGRPAEAGFLLIEAVVAVALIAICAGAALTAAAAVTRATARAVPVASLGLTARNVLTDLRAATVYDPDQLAALAGKATTFDALEPRPDGSSQAVRISARVTYAAATDAYTGSVTAQAPDGTSVTVEATLTQEAPAPGSVVPASLSPLAAPLSADSGAPDPISL